MTEPRIRRRRTRIPGVVRPHRPRAAAMTDEELAELEARAHAAGVEVPVYLVMRGLANEDLGAGRPEVIEELFTLRRLLAGAATNLNQMAKVANATGEVEVSRLAAEVAWLRELAGPGGRLDEVIKGFRMPRRRGKRSARDQ